MLEVLMGWRCETSRAGRVRAQAAAGEAMRLCTKAQVLGMLFANFMFLIVFIRASLYKTRVNSYKCIDHMKPRANVCIRARVQMKNCGRLDKPKVNWVRVLSVHIAMNIEANYVMRLVRVSGVASGNV